MDDGIAAAAEAGAAAVLISGCTDWI